MAVAGLAAVADESGWPLRILEDREKQGICTDSLEKFIDFLCRGKHSDGEMCILRQGLGKLELIESVPQTLQEACRTQTSVVEALLETINQGEDPWAGELLWWPPGGLQREEVYGIDMRSKLLKYRPFVETCYAAELKRSQRVAKGSELTDSLTSRDLKDLCPKMPFWDRGHGFLGGSGAGFCLHVDQAWWSNVAKNFCGQKLVALWPPGTSVLESCGGELFRKPLCARHERALESCSRVAVLQPGDLACFTGGLPHTTLVVGSALNLTFYESFLNWNSENLSLLLSGLQRPVDQAWWQNNMEKEFRQTVVNDILRTACDKDDTEDARSFAATLSRLLPNLSVSEEPAKRRRRSKSSD